MKITWLGQAGFLLEHRDKKILIDPYLSNSCGEKNPASNRRIPVDEKYLALCPDVIVLTHDHLDHTDPQTLEHYLPGKGGCLVLASRNSWNRVRQYGGDNNYVQFCPGTRWSWEGLLFTAVPAEHSDDYAIGVIVSDGEKKYYFTGDTLHNTRVLESLPKDLFAVFLPVNGKGNNMNFEDGADFALKTGARFAVPMHVGMFDSLSPMDFPAPNRVIPTVYQPVFGEEE